MPASVDVLVVLCLMGLVSVPYVLYPWVIALFAPRPASSNLQRPPSTVSVLIPMHNEAPQVEGKLENTLALERGGVELDIVVASDGSEDATFALAKNFEKRGVRVLGWTERKGKTAALAALVRASRGEVVVFTDASAQVSPDAITKLSAAFRDPEVGVAVARYVCGDAQRDTEGRYFAAETWLKHREAARDMLLGAHGACYAIRRELIEDVPLDTIHDDLVIPLLARARGRRIAYCMDTIAYDAPSRDLAVVFHRTARIAQGNVQALIRYRHLLSPSAGRVALSLWCHKALKTLGPVWLLALSLFVSVRGTSSVAMGALAALGWLTAAAGGVAVRQTLAGRALPPLLSLLAHACVAQVACGWGILRALRSAETVRWKRAPENDPVLLARPAMPPRSVRFAKRLFDIVGSALLLVALWPIMLLVAIAIRLESKGRAVYRQERMSFDDLGHPRSFVMLKFRSMRSDAEANGVAVWALAQDPRITRVGAFIRRTRLDELPQLLNVLYGDMSLVGPRPERPSIVSDLDKQIPGYHDRLYACKPGITGWAQVHTGYDTSVDSVRRKLLFDFAYVAHLYTLRSYVIMEFRVALKTISVMVFGKGAH